MTLPADEIDTLYQHWALDAVGMAELRRADRLANERLAKLATGDQITFSFVVSSKDDPFLERTALAYEMAAIEGLDELSRPAGTNRKLRDQAISASYMAFNIRRVLPIPPDTSSRLSFVLHISAMAYCGDRWSDLKRWYNDNDDALSVPSVAEVTWDHRLLYRLFDCWLRLFRKNGWDDLDRIREIIAGLREDQQHFEPASLNNQSTTQNYLVALRLSALYHWAKGTEILARYMLQGEPPNPFPSIDQHFESALQSAIALGDPQHEVVLRWLYATARIMVSNSLWWATRTINSKTSEFVRSLTHRKHHAMFELLPPQRAALLEQGLLDQAKTAIVIDMPTSGGKTLLAEFRILQALNQFKDENGWVAYVAPTRALSAQITRRLRKDFSPIGVKVEQLTAAIEIDSFEDDLLSGEKTAFHVLVATPEKLSLVIRNKRVERPLALMVMDEAHNIESESRGLRIELLLATVRRDCARANFLLLTPMVDDADAIARWLAQDVAAGQAISLGTTPWKPNERIIGLYRAVEDSSKRAGWRMEFETLTATPKAMPLHGRHQVGGVRPLNIPKSKVTTRGKQKGVGLQTAAMGAVMSARGPSVTIANKIDTVWNMARMAAESLPKYSGSVPDDIRLVQDFLRIEISANFELIALLERGVGVHHAGLPDEVRTLMEWLAEGRNLRMLCATSTITQGIDFPISSIFLQSRFVPQGRQSVEMAPREFWNLAGRGGRVGQDSVGVVGLAEGSDREALINFVSQSTGSLVSRLVTLIDELSDRGELNQLSNILWQDQWDDFRCYIAHLWAERKNLEAVLEETEQFLRQTYGYTTLRNDPAQRNKADALLAATRSYAKKLEKDPSHSQFADSTGFSPEGVAHALAGIRGLENRLTPSDWMPDNLFGNSGKMASLFGVMLNIPQLGRELDEIGGSGFDNARLSHITCDWVNGKRIDEIAEQYFSSKSDDESSTNTITIACRAIYRAIVNNGTWGVSALSHISGLDFDKLSEVDRRRINALPAMIYHGVRTEDAVIMRMNSAPRSAAEALGRLYRDVEQNRDDRFSVGKARDFLRNLDGRDWNRVRHERDPLSGTGYRRIWRVLSGEDD